MSAIKKLNVQDLSQDRDGKLVPLNHRIELIGHLVECLTPNPYTTKHEIHRQSYFNQSRGGGELKNYFKKSLTTLLALYGAGLIVSLVGLLVIVGWYTHTSSFVQISPAYTPMQYNTALCFLLAGLGLITYLSAPRLSGILGLFIFLISAITLGEYLFSVDVGLDQFFITPYLITNTTYPGRMAPNTALYMSLLGFSLGLRFSSLSIQSLPLLRFALALFVALAGMIGLFGYLTDIEITYAWGRWAQMAVHTSFCFAIIGMGLATIIWREFHLSVIKQSIKLPMMIIVLGSLLFILLWQVLVQEEHRAILQKSQERTMTIGKLLTNKFGDHLLGLKRLQRRYSQRDYATDIALTWDAKNYLHDMPALIGLMITKEKLRAHPLLLQVQTTDAKHVIQRCAVLNQEQPLRNNTLLVISHLQKNYLCLASPVSHRQLLVALFDIQQLMHDIAEQLLDSNDHAVKLLFGRQVLYQSHYKNTMYQHAFGTTIPLVLQNLSLQLHGWPTLSVKHYQSWFPIITLFTGLFVTFLLAFMVHLFQVITEKEKKFRSVLNTTSDAIITVNQNGKVILANQAALKLFEYTEREILGMLVESLMPEKFREAHTVYRHHYMKSPVAREMGVMRNIVIITKHGKEVPVEIGLNPLIMNLEQCILCSIHDMRIAKKNEKQLKQQSQSMQAMLDITNAIVTEGGIDVTLQRCLTILCTNLQWPIGHVYLVDANDPDLLIPSEIWFLKTSKKIAHFRDVTMKTSLPYGVGLSGRALASGAPVWIDDVCLENNFPRALAAKADNVHSAFAFPFTLHGKAVGVFEFFSYDQKKQDKDLLLIINLLKNQMSYFLEYQATQDLNKNLATRFKFAVASGKIGVWEYNINGKKLIWDEQMYRLYGLNPRMKNFSYSTWEKALHPDDVKKVTEEFQQGIMGKESFDKVFRIVKPNGDIRYIQAHAMVIDSAGEAGKSIFGLNRDITEEKQLTEELEQLNIKLVQHAYYDSLTGLMNRHALEDAVKRMLSLAKRHGYQLGILFIDLDNFKSVNDRFGHTIGDELLVEVAKRLTKMFRHEDAVCRMGGDEFLIVLNHIEITADAVVIANKIVSSIAQPFHLASHDVHVGASVGVSFYPESGKTFADLLNTADAALLQAKHAGKGCVRVFKKEE